MTTESYKRFLNVFFIVFIPISLAQQFRDFIGKFITIPAFWLIVLYANSILALTLLYFGIYAHISGIKKEPKSSGPVVYIFLGCLLVLLSFGRPLFAAYMMNKVEKNFQPIHTRSENLEKQKKGALDATIWSSERIFFAKNYYLETGKSVEYIDIANNKKFYEPDKETKEHYEKMSQVNKEMKQINAFVRIDSLAHASILLLSIPTFLLFIRHKKKLPTE